MATSYLRIEARELTEQQLIRKLGISDEQYRMLIFETGIAYLERMEGKDSEYFTRISKTKQFWNWWTLRWHTRDRNFLYDVYPKLNPKKQNLGSYLDHQNIAKRRLRYSLDDAYQHMLSYIPLQEEQ